LTKKFPSVWEKCQKTAGGIFFDSHRTRHLLYLRFSRTSWCSLWSKSAMLWFYLLKTLG